jgi:hypothetical protein
MSEKIYAFLLRLLPTAFCGHYEEESLRLFRDRLRDETGLARRLRLTLDLLVDIFRALPQAYRNSYASVAAAAPLTSHFDGVPTFRTLRAEPIRREVIVIAGVCAITVLATFTFVMGLSVPYRLVTPDGRMSPIASVIDRLNRPISPTPVDTGAMPATSEVNQSPQPSNEIAKAHSSSRSSPAAASSAPLMVKKPMAISNVTSPPLPVANVDLSGRWTTVIGASDVPRWFLFTQDSVKLTGTAGPDSSQRYRILHGLVAGDSVSFELQDAQSTFRYDLRFTDKALRGTLAISTRNETRSTTVLLRRIQ